MQPALQIVRQPPADRPAMNHMSAEDRRWFNRRTPMGAGDCRAAMLTNALERLARCEDRLARAEARISNLEDRLNARRD